MAIQEHLPDCRTLLTARFARLATVRQSLASGLGGLVLKSSRRTSAMPYAACTRAAVSSTPN
ncbi:hypothetical protein SVIOM74S_03658 [Streptomyces violarus]